MRLLIRSLELVVIALMGTISALVIAEVALRNLLGMSLIITDELSRSLMSGPRCWRPRCSCARTATSGSRS